MYAWQAGGSLVTSAGKWNLNTPQMVDALDYNASFFTAGTADTSGPTFLDAQPYFVSGKTASMITGPWVIGQLDTAAKKSGWTASHVATAPARRSVEQRLLLRGRHLGRPRRQRQHGRRVEARPASGRAQHAGRAVQGVRLAAGRHLRLGRPGDQGPAAAGRLLHPAQEHPRVPAGQYVAAGRDPAGQGGGGRRQGQADRGEGGREHPGVRRERRHGHAVMTTTLAPATERATAVPKTAAHKASRARRTAVAWLFLAPSASSSWSTRPSPRSPRSP